MERLSFDKRKHLKQLARIVLATGDPEAKQQMMSISKMEKRNWLLDRRRQIKVRLSSL